MTQMQPTESVWDYPRPPRLEAVRNHLRIVHRGVLIAETRNALRVLETSHPPVFYLPPADVRMEWLRRSPTRNSFCEFKGVAVYWSLDLATALPAAEARSAVRDVAWSYPQPTPAFLALKDHLAFYASRVDECTVDDERVQAQAGDFYGGWITSRVTGPFKGAPGTRFW